MKQTWVFQITPVPASRPKIGRWSTYYGKRYTAFRKQIPSIRDRVIQNWVALSCPLRVQVHNFVTKPKTSKRKYPQGDVDNFVKSILDALNTVAWDDDDQIIDLRVTKQFGPINKIVLTVEGIHDLDTSAGNQSKRSNARQHTAKRRSGRVPKGKETAKVSRPRRCKPAESA